MTHVVDGKTKDTYIYLFIYIYGAGGDTTNLYHKFSSQSLESQGPGSQGPRVPGLRFLGSWVLVLGS